MDEFLFVGIAHALFVMVFLAYKEKKSLTDKLFLTWIFFLAMPLVSRCFSINISVPFLSIDFAYPLLFGPLLWLYVESLIAGLKKLSPKYFLHFLPFILIAILQLLYFSDSGFPLAEHLPGKKGPKKFIGLINFFSLLVYSGVALFRLQQYRKKMTDHFSTLSGEVTLKWLNWITIVFVITYMLPMTKSFILLPLIFYSHGLAFTVYIFVLSFFGLKQTQLDENVMGEVSAPKEVDEILVVDSKIKLIEKEDVNNKYQRSGLSPEQAKRYTDKLNAYMKQEKPYLDASLNVEKLAKQVVIPRHYLTQIMSECLKKNFYLFVNEYRVEAVKALIETVEGKNMTLLDIAYVCGFNSKSTFNTAFKKIMDMTPSQYKKIASEISG